MKVQKKKFRKMEKKKILGNRIGGDVNSRPYCRLVVLGDEPLVNCVKCIVTRTHITRTVHYSEHVCERGCEREHDRGRNTQSYLSQH